MSLDAPQLSGQVDASHLKVGIVVSRFNEDITSALRDGAVSALCEHGADANDIDVFHVPGALEIPTVAAALYQRQHYDAIVCLGCVIKGGTAHFEHVCRVAMDSIGRLAERGDIPVTNGILTVDTHEQAVERTGGIHGHKGEEAALTAIEIVETLRKIEAIHE